MNEAQALTEMADLALDNLSGEPDPFADLMLLALALALDSHGVTDDRLTDTIERRSGVRVEPGRFKYQLTLEINVS